MALTVWKRGDSALEGGIFEVWGRVGEWTCKLGRGAYGCGLWRGIRMGWKDEMEVKPRDFDIFSYYNQLRGSYSVVFPWKGIWKVKACVPFLVWTVAWNMELNSYRR